MDAMMWGKMSRLRNFPEPRGSRRAAGQRQLTDNTQSDVQKAGAHTLQAAHGRLLCVNAGLYLGMHGGGGYYLHSLVFTCICIHRIKHILFPEYILISVTVSRAPLQLLSNCMILMTFFSKDRRERVGSYLVTWQHKSNSNCSFVAVAAALENSV